MLFRSIVRLTGLKLEGVGARCCRRRAPGGTTTPFALDDQSTSEQALAQGGEVGLGDGFTGLGSGQFPPGQQLPIAGVAAIDRQKAQEMSAPIPI